MNSNEILNNNRIDGLVAKLRVKLNKFVVVDAQGEPVGEVNDLILDDNRQLNLVISQLGSGINSRLFLLISKLIQKIDPPNKAVLVNLKKEEIESLPEYTAQGKSDLEFSEIIPSLESSEPEDEMGDIIEGYPFEDSLPVGETTEVTPTPLLEPLNMQNDLGDITFNSDSEFDNGEFLEEEIIRLLGERVVVERNKRKVGEVIVRKEVETRMIQVPVRQEKLIVEQVSPEHKQLAEINLGQEEILPVELLETAITQHQATSLNGELTVSGEFDSPKIASLLLNAVALERNQGCKKVRVEIVVEDEERQKTYQQWFARVSDK